MMVDMIVQQHNDPTANWPVSFSDFYAFIKSEKEIIVGEIVVLLWSCAIMSAIIWSGHNCTREQVTRKQPMDTGP